ncbi:MAG: TonB-dependent receptor [Bacteroidia bacterium]
MRKILTLFSFFLCTLTGFAQSFIKGKITDKANKEAMPGALVAAGNMSAVTGVDGNFLLKMAAGKHIFIANLIGYKTYKKDIITNDNDTLVMNIEMEESNQVLDEVVVSAGKYEQKLSDITVSMEVIKPDLLQNKCTAQLDQIMNQVPGVYMTDGQVSVRGGSGYSYGAGSRVIMLVDEMPMLSADAGDIKFNYVPIETMEQVEIIKGASSALFGSSALNGVINLRTKYARDKPETIINTYTGIYGNSDVDSYNWWKTQHRSNPTYQGTTFAHSQKLGNFDLVMGGQLYNDEGFRGGSDSKGVFHSASEQRIRGNTNLRYNFKKIPGLSVGVNSTIMSYRGNLFFLWKDNLHPYLSRDSSLQGYENQRANIDPFIVWNNEKWGRHSIRGRYFLTNNTNNTNGVDQSSRAELYYGEYQWQKRFRGDFNFAAGLVTMRQVVLAQALYGTHYGQNYAGYFQADKRFFNRLTVSVGARAEYYKVDTSQTKGGFFLLNNPTNTPLPVQPVMRAGLNFQAAKFTFFRASFGQGYRFPTVAEKYINTYVGSLNIFPNASLQPEKGWSAEIGVKQGFKIGNFKGFADVAGFVMHYYNMIDFVFKYDTVGKTAEIFNAPKPLSELVKHAGFQSQNIGRANIPGIDISLTGTGKIGPIKIDLLSGFTYTKPINPLFNPKTDTTGTLRSNLLRYRNTTMFKADVQLTYKQFSIGWSTRYADQMKNIDVRMEKPLIYETMDPSVTSIYNLPDFYLLPGLKKYREQHPFGIWVNDFRIGYQASEHLKLSFLINNVLNAEFMSRPGLIEQPRTFVFQMSIKF